MRRLRKSGCLPPPVDISALIHSPNCSGRQARSQPITCIACWEGTLAGSRQIKYAERDVMLDADNFTNVPAASSASTRASRPSVSMTTFLDGDSVFWRSSFVMV